MGYRRNTGIGAGVVMISLALLLVGILILSCTGVQMWALDKVVGYECSGEGIEYTCVPEGAEPESEVTDEEVVPSNPKD